MTKEIWKPIPGYEGLYDVSNKGRVRRTCDGHHYKKGDILKGSLFKGYPRIGLHKNNLRKRFGIHYLVLLVFQGQCPKGKQASHLNDIKADNRLENLAWMTHKENMQLAVVNKKHPMLSKHHSKKTKKKMSEARKKYWRLRNARKI